MSRELPCVRCGTNTRLASYCGGCGLPICDTCTPGHPCDDEETTLTQPEPTVSSLERRAPVLIGEIGNAPPGGTIEIHTTLPDRACGDCRHPASRHADVPPEPEGTTGGHCDGCRDKKYPCTRSRLEAAGWVPPDGCAGNCR